MSGRATGSFARSEAENAASRQALDAALHAAGVAFWPGVGGEPEGGPGRWRDEVHRLALGLTAGAALSWGRRFRQNAVLHVRRGEAVRLLDCRAAPSAPDADDAVEPR